VYILIYYIHARDSAKGRYYYKNTPRKKISARFAYSDDDRSAQRERERAIADIYIIIIYRYVAASERAVAANSLLTYYII